MKKTLLILFVLLATLNTNAQEQSEYELYAIDGTGWPSQEARNEHELSLTKDILSNIKYLKNTEKPEGSVPNELLDAYTKMFRECGALLNNIRKLNKEQYLLKEGIVQEVLVNRNIIVEPRIASNNEYFELKEAAQLFDFVIEEYFFFSHELEKAVDSSEKGDGSSLLRATRPRLSAFENGMDSQLQTLLEKVEEMNMAIDLFLEED